MGFRAEFDLGLCQGHPMSNQGRPTTSRSPSAVLSRRWLDASRAAERSGDWRPLADFFTDDATYGWNIGRRNDVMCLGVDEIRDVAFGQEMKGLLGWRYPYQRVLIDERLSEVVGFSKRVATDTTGTDHEVYGIVGNWLGYAGNGKWCWQRDFSDFGHVVGPYSRLLKSGNLSRAFAERIATNALAQRRSQVVPAWAVPRADLAAPHPRWPRQSGQVMVYISSGFFRPATS